MALALRIVDETATGTPLSETVLWLASERITLRELIRRRLAAEVEQFNSNLDKSTFNGLVQPEEAEQVLNGYKTKKRRPIRLEEQLDAAFSGFERNAFFVLVGDRQVEDLDDEITVANNQQVSFIKLVPLVGG